MSDRSEPLERARHERAGLRAAIGRVERSLATAARGRVDAWSKELSDELDDLDRALELHIATTEAPDGLLADIVEAAPRLVHRVDQTRDDHTLLREHVARARAALRPDDDAVPAARDRVVELLTALVRHRHLGADLVYEAYNVDIEAGD